MSEVCCKRCGAADHMKNGIVRDVQRYLCRSCGCNFTMTPPRGKPPAMKALAMLYAMGNVSFCSIARILGVSDVAVLNWVRDEARKNFLNHRPRLKWLSSHSTRCGIL
jgi:transposase-like protein